MNNFKILSLDKAKISRNYIVMDIEKAHNNQLYRMYDFGLIKNSLITPLYISMFKGCTAYLIKNCVIAIRNNDAKKIFVREAF